MYLLFLLTYYMCVSDIVNKDNFQKTNKFKTNVLETINILKL